MYKVSLDRRVRDRVEFIDGGEKLRLTVSGESARLVASLQKAMEQLKAITSDSTEQELEDAALALAGAMFGEAQAKKLMEFYQDDCGSVISACTKYFNMRLSGKIAEVQRKIK